MRARLLLRVSVVLALAWGPIRADSLLVGERQWANAKIQWVQDGKVRFTASDGTQQAVPVTTVTRLQVDLRDDLNRAEQLRSDGKTAEAAPAYEAALRTENSSYLGGFIRYRLMDLYGRLGQLDRAAEMFLDLVKQPDFHAVVKDWRPTNVAGVRPKVREAAISALDEGLRQIRTGLASESVREMRDYIQKAPASVAGGEGAPATAASGGARRAPAPSTAPVEAVVAPESSEAWAVLKTLRAGQYAQALQAADQALLREGLSRDLLADALYVRGVARWELAREPAQLLQAGWAFSRLLVECPSSSHVPESLYYLGLVHQRLGQPAAARPLLLQAQQSAGTAELRERVRKAMSE